MWHSGLKKTIFKPKEPGPAFMTTPRRARLELELELERTRTRTNTNPCGTETNAEG